MGERCHFAHGIADLRAPNKPNVFVAPNGQLSGSNNYKTVPCKYFTQDGVCNFGDKCSFAHGLEDMRAKPVSSLQSYEPRTMDPLTGLYRSS